MAVAHGNKMCNSSWSFTKNRHCPHPFSKGKCIHVQFKKDYIHTLACLFKELLVLVAESALMYFLVSVLFRRYFLFFIFSNHYSLCLLMTLAGKHETHVVRDVWSPNL